MWYYQEAHLKVFGRLYMMPHITYSCPRLVGFVARDAFEPNQCGYRRVLWENDALSARCMHHGPIFFDSRYLTKFAWQLSASTNRVFVNATRHYVHVCYI